MGGSQNGIAGAADSILVLKRDREDANAVLHVTSRDAKEGSYGLTLDDTGNWLLAGTCKSTVLHCTSSTALWRRKPAKMNSSMSSGSGAVAA